MKRLSKKLLVGVLVILMLAGLAGCTQPNTGAANNAPDNAVASQTDAKALTEQLQSKYEDQGDYTYAAALTDQKKDVSFDFESSLSPDDLNVEKDDLGDYVFNKLVDVFVDSSFTISAKPNITYSADTGTYTVNPPFFAPLAPTTVNDTSYTCPNPWGLASQYYMVRYYDLETGEKLDKPIVTVFAIAQDTGAPGAPFLQFKKSDTGFAAFTWDAVPGADKYDIYYIGDSASGLVLPLAEGVTGTYAVGDQTDNLGGYTLLNLLFRPDFGYKYFYAVAEKDGVLSPASNLISIDSVRNSLVYTFDFSNDNFKLRIKNLNDLPAYMPVKMCNDSTVMYPVSYNLDEYKVQTLMDVYGRQMGDLDMSQKFGTVPVMADGTSITAVIFFENYTDPGFEQNLQATIEKLDAVKGKAGADNSVSVSRENGQSETSGAQETSVTVPTEFPVFASSALSEYLAINMLSGNSKIDISGFNEASDIDYLLDCFYEAYYQNPLILMVDGLKLSFDGSKLYVIYGQTKEEQARKQDEIKQEVYKVVGQIIKDGMTDLEKETAINDYLCQSADYDEAALEDAMANDMVPDKKFDDSFTAYGILVNKVGVCASYAASFKLLADMSGLDAIVTTGYLNGYLPHAWNRVKIDNQWMTIDVTNNDNPDLYNALFNLWDDVSAPVLVEDQDFVLDSELSKYTTSDNSLEYYRQIGKYYSVSDIGAKLAEGLDKYRMVTLRTNEDLTSDELISILSDVANNPIFDGRESELQNVEVYAYLGCITLKYSDA